MFVLFGLPVFHRWLKAPATKIVTFKGIFCAAQLAVTPSLFSARATPRNPTGQIARRAIALVVWFSAAMLLLLYSLRRSLPENLDTRRFTSITTILTVLFGILGLIKYCVSPCRKDSTVVTKSKEWRSELERQ
jgi:hypothetical protein